MAGAVFGTVSVMALIVTAAHAEPSAQTVLAFAATSTVVLWGMHVYAAMLANAGSGEHNWAPALRHALRNETGVVEGAVTPLAVLALGAFGWVEDGLSIWLAMWTGVLVLFLVPIRWLRLAHRPWPMSLLWGAGGGVIGLLLVWLKVALH